MHTPVPYLLKLTQAEAIQWLEACNRFQNPSTSEH